MASDLEDEEFYDDDVEEEENDDLDFIPDDDEDDDDEDAMNEDQEAFGTWSLDQEQQKISFQGDGFCLVSTEPVPWNLLDPTSCPSNIPPNNEQQQPRVRLTLVGPCEFGEAASGAAAAGTIQKPKAPRTIEVTWTIGSGDVPSYYQSMMMRLAEKEKEVGAEEDNEGDEDDDDVKKPAASPTTNGKPKADNNGDIPTTGPALYYEVHGREIIHANHTSSKGLLRLEFFGICQPQPPYEKQQPGVGMPFRWRSSTIAETTTTTAAAAAAQRDDEDDDDEDETEVAVDYDELIALHEDAGLSVDALMRKRYRDKERPDKDGAREDEDERDEMTKPAATNKKARGDPAKSPQAPPKDDDDDDDDDVEF